MRTPCIGVTEVALESDQLFENVASLLARQQGYPRAKISAATRLGEDVGMDGDDAWEFFGEYARVFGVDLAGFKLYHHFGPEGFSLLWLFFPPWWKEVQQIPVTVQNLVDAATAGRWILAYPHDPAYKDSVSARRGA
jgi:hypothetical protein